MRSGNMVPWVETSRLNSQKSERIMRKKSKRGKTPGARVAFFGKQISDALIHSANVAAACDSDHRTLISTPGVIGVAVIKLPPSKTPTTRKTGACRS